MPARVLPIVALLTFFVGLAAEQAPVAQAQQPGASPALLLRLRSIEGLQADAKYLIKLAGTEEASKQVEGLLQVYIQGSGIDTKNPWGAYGNIGQQGFDSSAVLLIPIGDEKAFLKKLDGFGLNVKNQAGLYSIVGVVNQQDAYMRFANSYAYISNDKTAVGEAAKLVAPSGVFDPKDTAAISLVLRINQIPKNLRDAALDGLSAAIDLAKNQKAPDETETQTKFKLALIDSMMQDIRNLLNDGNELALRVDVDSKGGNITADLSLNAKAGSKLAASLKSWEAKSIFGTALGSDSALNLLVNTALSDKIKQAMGPVIDEGIQKALTQEKKPENKELAEKFLKVLTPTLKSGEFDFAVTLRGPGAGDKYTVAAGMKLKDGIGIDKTLREIVKNLKKEEQDRITFDAEKIGAVNVHKLDVAKDMDAKAKAFLGDGPLYVGFRQDAVFFAAGENALGALKDAVSAKPTAAPAVQMEMSLARFAAAVGKDDKDFAAAAQAAFGDGSKGNDKLRITLEGGTTLRLRFAMKGDALKFFAELGKRKGAVPAGQ